jgi:dephospho-CoA kinase
MMRIGLTGGIGSGKSLIAKIFNILNIPVFEADAVSRRIMSTNPEVRKNLISWFGNRIYPENELDRKALATILFNDPESLQRVSNLVHPLVFIEFMGWCDQNRNHPYVIHEAAILFETGFDRRMDYNILVTAPLDIRIGRIIGRDQTSGESVLERMKNQWPDEKKIPLADFIILNDGVKPVLPEVLYIHNFLTSKPND